LFLPSYTGLSREQEAAFLEGQKRLMEETLGQINKRLEELREGSSIEMSR